MQTGILIVLSLVYVGLLFAIAYWGDSREAAGKQPLNGPLVYSLSLAVYCTSWTFYGAVGTAVSTGWGYVPIYLGPIIMVVFGWEILRRIVEVSKKQNLTTIADFIAARYGMSRGVSMLVTVSAVVGMVPYISLQLKAVATSFDVVTGGQAVAGGGASTTAFYLALVLAVFAILFGTRHIDASEHHRGMMLAIAAESVVKLIALVAVGAFAMYSVMGGPREILESVVIDERLSSVFLPSELPGGFMAQTLLAMAAIFCLPRQYHVAVVECGGEKDLRMARWLFPTYLVIIMLAVFPIAMAGLKEFGIGQVDADTFVLALPMAYDRHLLSLFAFLGGFSAATSMVIVATVALATMVSNDIVLPLLLGAKSLGIHLKEDLSRILLYVRRATIIALTLAAYVYYRLTGESSGLASIGLLSFAAAAQFAPPIIAGLFWRNASRRGALSGLTLGFSIWAYTLLFPGVARSSGGDLGWVLNGIWGIDWLRPEALFGLEGMTPITHGVLLSLSMNMLGLVIGSILWPPSLREQLQAVVFIEDPRRTTPALPARWQQHATVGDLQALAARFVGRRHSVRAFEKYENDKGIVLAPGVLADGEIVRYTERLLAGAIGSASARAVLTAALKKTGMAIGDMLALLDQTADAVTFNRRLLDATLHSITQGVAVADKDLRIVGWNRRYLELLNYPEGMVYVGRPVADLIRFNAERGLCGPGEVIEHVSRRLQRMRDGQAYRYERQRPDGQVIEIRGNRMPGGGYVSTYTDITEHKRVELALRESEHNIRLYTDNAPLMLSYLDKDQRFGFANKSYLDYVNLPADQVVGKLVKDVLSPAQLVERSEYLERALTGKRQEFEVTLKSVTGEEMYCLGTYIPEFDESGEVSGLYAMFQDITSRRRAELALEEAKANLELRVEERTDELQKAMSDLQVAKGEAEQANRSKTRFLAAATHDLLQPLNAARLFASVLSEQSESLPPEQSKLVDRVDNSLAAAEDLLGALLDISKLDSGALVPEISQFRLRDLLDVLHKQFEPLARARGLELKVRGSGIDCVVKSDRQLLRRIFQNLISNAFRYSEDGRVLVAARRRGKEVEVQVWDQGQGIPEENLEDIFVEFRRLQTGPGGKEKGLGLGLAIVDRVSNMLGHSILVRSELSRGSMFSVSVPLAENQVVVGKPAAPVFVPSGKLGGARVICVDNEQEILDGMQALLERWGCVVTIARSSEHLLKILPEGMIPDVMLVDYRLDNENGLDVVRKLNEHLGVSVPGAFITADNSDEVKHLIREAGYLVLGKPVRPASLRATLTSLLRGRETG
ncbi:MAG: PAS-domain containing protein [Chromatiales bacterium]|nr:PAS-domain containing protein [Chromatiales bacterium]